MTEHYVTHATLNFERTYDAPVTRVFAAWADTAAKARWFVGSDGEHEFDFRVGGREINRGRQGDGPMLAFESHYLDIVEGERIVYTSTLSADDVPATVSVTTVEFSVEGEGTRMVLTQQGAFLDGREEPAWREQGTSDQLDALGVELGGAPAGGR